MRQLTAHILMLQSVMRDLLQREDIERIQRIANEAAATTSTEQGRQIILIREQLQALAAEQKDKQAKNQAAPDNGDLPTEDDITEEQLHEQWGGDDDSGTQETDSGRKFGKSFDFKPYLKSLTTGENWDKVKKKAKCSACHKSPQQPYITECFHIICYKCYENLFMQMAEQGQENIPCKACGNIFRYAHPCSANGDLEDDIDVGPQTRSKRRQAVRPELEEVRDDWLSIGGRGVLPSAKTIAIKAQILNWLKEDPKVKIIIYTQFLAM